MICTLWTPFQAEMDWKIHTERFSKFHSNIYFILFGTFPGFAIFYLKGSCGQILGCSFKVAQLTRFDGEMVWYAFG